MTSILEGSLAATLGRAMTPLFLDATLTRYVAGVATDPAEPPTPTTVTYACKAIEEEYSSGVRGAGLVNATDVNVLILAYTLAVEPKAGDRITIRSRTVTVVPADSAGTKAVRSDPARATWQCRCST